MASEKDKAAEKKSKANAKLQETAAKKRREEEEAQVAASFLVPPPAPAPDASGASYEDSDRESGPRVEPASPEPSTGQVELPATEEVVTPVKESTLPDHLRFD
eukprot:2270718-Rhodomonas_salina.1